MRGSNPTRATQFTMAQYHLIQWHAVDDISCQSCAPVSQFILVNSCKKKWDKECPKYPAPRYLSFLLNDHLHWQSVSKYTIQRHDTATRERPNFDTFNFLAAPGGGSVDTRNTSWVPCPLTGDRDLKYPENRWFLPPPIFADRRYFHSTWFVCHKMSQQSGSV